MSKHRASSLLDLDDVGKTSRKYRRQTLSALPFIGGTSSMARHRVLPVAPPVQIGALGQEAQRGSAILSR
jgi:hypothetical protein